MSLSDQIGDLFLEELRGLLEGAEDDIRRFGTKVGAVAAAAVIIGDEKLMQQAKDQVRMLGEIQRIRLKEIQWDFVEKIFIVAVKAVMIGVGFAK